jgi:outer membrane protein assembly factor BamB
VALDPTTGTVQWTLPRATGGLVPPAIDPEFGVHGLVVYVEGAGVATALVAIDPTTRRQVWRATLDDSVLGGPAIDGSRVFVGVRNGSVVALDESTGKVAWRFATSGPVDSAPAVSGGRVYAVSKTPQPTRAHLYALDAATGRMLWGYLAPPLSENTSSPTAAEGRVFLGFGDLTVRAFDAVTGKLLWRTPVRGDFDSANSPAYSQGGLFLEDAEGSVYRLDARKGTRLWDFQFLSLSESAAPLVAARTVYAGLDDGSVAALDASTGHLVWRTTLRLGPIGPFASAGDLLLAPTVGPSGGMAAFRTDPGGTLKDIPSPTELHLGIAIGNFVAAFAIMLVFVYGLFALIARRGAVPTSRGTRPFDVPESEDASVSEEREGPEEEA